MSKRDNRNNKEVEGVEAPGPIDRALDRDRDDKADILEGGADQKRTAASGTNREGEIRVPVAEERLAVGKREVELGEVQVHKTVESHEETVPVTLHREEVNVQEVDVQDRPATGKDLFEEGTIRVPVRGEEAVVSKEAVVTGEVVIDKNRVADEHQVTETVRKQRVEVDENYNKARSAIEKDFSTRKAAAKDDWIKNRTFEQAEPNYRAGFEAASDTRYANRNFEDVENEIRRDYESNPTYRSSGDSWEHLRQEIREGWNHARRV